MLLERKKKKYGELTQLNYEQCGASLGLQNEELRLKAFQQFGELPIA